MACRWGFFFYGAVLFVATHWPALRIEGTGRPDLVIHVAAFAVWTSALIAARFFGPLWSVRNIVMSGLCGVVYAAIDEVLQAIPWVRRTAALDDYAADLGGVLLAVVAALVLSRVARRGPRVGSDPE